MTENRPVRVPLHEVQPRPLEEWANGRHVITTPATPASVLVKANFLRSQDEQDRFNRCLRDHDEPITDE